MREIQDCKKKHVILTIDDDHFIRSSFKSYLEDYDYLVLEAEDGRSALEKFRNNPPDLVLVDLRIPGLSGLEVISRLKELAPEIPVIIVSGTGVIEDAIGAIRLGAWDYILKPVTNLSVLKHSIERNLERSRLLKENKRYKEHLEELVLTRTEELEKINLELEKTRLQIIRRLGKAAEFKDNKSGRHVIRVSLFATHLAENMGLDLQTVQLIYYCSPMHDIGKIGIPDSILLKADKLDADEWEIAKSHSRLGSELLEILPEDELELYRSHTLLGERILGDSESELLQIAKKIALYHHEHWDGSGYPAGLQGEAIPIEARIVSVADVYDSLSNDRPYKTAYPEEQCQQIIRKLSGIHLDPHIVTVFFKSIDKILEIKQNWRD